MARHRRDRQTAYSAVIAGVLAAQFVVAAANPDFVTVYVGSGGCDGSDPTCHPKPDEQSQLQALKLRLENGELAPRSDLAQNVNDLPIWMASTDECVFVMRPNKCDIMSFKPGPDGRLSPGPSPTPSGGRTPVFATPTADKRFLLVANYNGPDDQKQSTGATVASFSIDQDCHLTLLDSKQHTGSSVNPQRQSAAHVHSVVPVSDKLVYACDLGMDVIFSYELTSDGKLNELARTKTVPGSGPRHLVQHPSQPVVYVVCEMGQIVIAYKQGPGGTLILKQSLSLLPDGAPPGGSKAAEIVIKADGSALYATNRGIQNTVTAFKVAWDGTLEKLQEVHAPDFPRGMTLSTSDLFLIVGGQSSSVVATYRIQPNGALETPSRSTADGVPPNPAAFLVLPPLPSVHSNEAVENPTTTNAIVL